jgi:hypothetical protein
MIPEGRECILGVHVPDDRDLKYWGKKQEEIYNRLPMLIYIPFLGLSNQPRKQHFGEVWECLVAWRTINQY